MFSNFSQRLAHLTSAKSPQRSGRHRKSFVSVALSMGLIAAALAAVSPARAQGDPLAETQSGEWSCTRDLGDGTQQGILYQIVYNNGQNILYSYSEDGSGTWSLDQEATFSLSSGEFFNALVMTPAGDMYAVLHRNSNPHHQLVKFNAPATVGGVASYDVVANFPSESTSKAVNFSSYVEINGDPYLAMSNNGKNINDELYNVTTGVFSDWNIVNAGNAKDAVWAPLGITSGGVTYPMVGVDENSANSVLYSVSGNTATLATTLTDLNGNSMSWDTSKAWGVGGSFGSADSLERQVEKFNEEDIVVEEVLWQAKQNFRQKFNMSAEIIIPADFSLHAGDLVHCDFPEISSKKTLQESQKDSGIYMIADLCHYGDKSQSYTGLHLVRDSFGIKN